MPEVLAPGVPSPAWGPWAPLGDGSGPARASSPGWVAGGLHVTRKVGTAVSAVWQYHLVVTVAAQEARTVPPMPQFTSRWRTAPSMGEGCSPPTPTLGADSSRRGQGDLPQPPASTLGTTGAQRPEQSPFVQAGPLLPLGRCPNPSRNRTRLGSAFEPPQEGSAELLKADEPPPPPPVKAVPSFSTQGAGSGHARHSADPLGMPSSPFALQESLLLPCASVSPS